MLDVHIISLGCPKNSVSSRRLEKALTDFGVQVTEEPSKAQAIIVNTCGFIEPAKEESINCLLDVASLKSQQPGLKVIAVGCLVQRYRDTLVKDIPEVDSYLTFDELNKIPLALGAKGELNMTFQAKSGGAVAYLEVAEGCDHGCSYCAIPAIRGAYESRPQAEILEEASYLATQGCKEVVLVGQDNGSYGRDLKGDLSLASLVERIGETPGIDWIRLLYVQPQHVSDHLIETIASNEKVCPYLDMPLQHASTAVIRNMNRWGGSDHYLKIIERLRAKVPDIALRTSIIIGFPGETDEDIMILSRFLKAAELDYVGVFQFSAEDGTPAADFPDQIEEEAIRERSTLIETLINEIAGSRQSRFVGRSLKVLMESVDGGASIGRSRYQAPEIDGEVIVEGCVLKPGVITDVKITGHNNYDLFGTRVVCRT